MQRKIWNFDKYEHELVNTMKRRKVNVACLEETKQKGAKAKDLVDGYKQSHMKEQ